MIDPHHEPTERELKTFGGLLLLFLLLVGALVYNRTGSVMAGQVLAGLGVVLSGVYYAVPPLRRPIFRGWLWLAFPIGFVVSHVLLGLVFYVVLLPVGLLLRVLGRDPMDRALDRQADSYWEAYDPQGEPDRYFHQS